MTIRQTAATLVRPVKHLGGSTMKFVAVLVITLVSMLSFGLAPVLADGATSTVPTGSTMQQRAQSTMMAAHRGLVAPGTPENTIRACVNAIHHGVKMCESDWQETSDHHAVQMHDDTLNRTTTCKGKVRSHTQYWIYKHCRYKNDGKHGDRVATIGQYVTYIKQHYPNTLLMMEWKEPNPSLAYQKYMVNAFNYYGQDKVYGETFWAHDLTLMKQRMPNVPRFWCNTGAPSVSKIPSAATGIIIPYDRFVSAEQHNSNYVAAVQNSGRQVYVWNEETTGDWRYSITHGVNGLISNHSGGYQSWARSL